MPSLVNLAIWAGAALASFSVAHPGHDDRAEAIQHKEFLERSGAPHIQKRCAAHFEASGYVERAMKRREALTKRAREKRGIPADAKFLKARDFAAVLATDHNETGTYAGVNMNTPMDSFFGDNTSCILQPAMTLAEGPYYVSGEYIRGDIVENQEGVEMVVDIQIIDINNCEPVEGIYLETWQANSTGTYSGTVGNGNGNPDDLGNINSTFLRGIQKTDSEGVMQVNTLFPGHYNARTAHIHILAHQNATLLPNNTLAGGTISHTGQLFFDQDLIDLVYTTAPYNTNTDALTLNSEDLPMNATSVSSDPVVEYAYVGEDVTDGLVSWITIGIDTTANETVNIAVWYTANGGVANPDTYIPGG